MIFLGANIFWYCIYKLEGSLQQLVGVGFPFAAHILAHPHPSYLHIGVRANFFGVFKKYPVKVRHLVLRCVPGISFRYIYNVHR